MQIAMLAADFTPGEADQLRRAMAAWKRKRRARAVPRAAGRPHGREGLRARVRRAHLQADPGLRRIRLSGEPCRRLRAAGLRHELDQAPPSDAFLCAPAQQPSRWASTRRRSWCATRASTASRCARSTSRSAAGRACSKKARPACLRRMLQLAVGPLGQGAPLCAVRLGLNRIVGLAEDVALAHRRRARRGAVRQRRRPGAARPPRRQAIAGARRRRRAAAARRPPPPGRLGGGRHRHPADRDAARHAHRRGAGRGSRRRARPRTRWPTTARSASP